MSDVVTKSIEYAGVLPRHRNLFRFQDGPVRLGVSCVPVPGKYVWWRRLLRLDKPAEVMSMMALSEHDFDDLDITRKGQPEAFCILAPGLGVCWPTTDRDYIVTVVMGA